MKILLNTSALFFLSIYSAFSSDSEYLRHPLFSSTEQKYQYYHERYKADCLSDKITNNHGDGYEGLYGTRNLRVILFGVAYRGGANNFYHKTDKRDNHNPLPADGLKNLCTEGFSHAVYLYGKNFNTAEKKIVSGKDTLLYIQNSGMNRKQQKEIIKMVYNAIKNPKTGPIYFHCWNGWHQSGFVSSIILKQFCGLTNDKALKYWEMNTDGNYKGFEKIKSMIVDFEPFEEYKIPKELQDDICPCLKDR